MDIESKEVKPIDTDIGSISLANKAFAMPVNFGDRYKMAGVLVQSRLLPPAYDTPEKVVVALQMGYELGLNPMVALNNIVVINGRPSLSTDIMLAIARSSKDYGGLTWTCADNKKAECILIRVSRGIKEEFKSCYTIEDATLAGLINKDNWKKYPQRMLKKRALSYALRDGFPDLFSGLYDPDEIEPVENIRQAEGFNTPVENMAEEAENVYK